MAKTSFKHLIIPALALPTLSLSAERPNIVIILADDMGYSDIACYGGEIETPTLDYLAENGLRYRQFYNGARSCPTRASLLTGLYPHQTGMGWMAAADLQRPAYQGYLNNNCVTIAEVLKDAGYDTYMSGKWHVSSDRQNSGGIKDNWPNQRGFDRFYGIVDGAANYFKTTYNNDNERHLSPKDRNFYFTHAISDSAAVFVQRHDYEKSPLFLYLAYTAPHWPLHALQQDIDKYIDRYKAGWDNLRQERFERQKEMGLFRNDVVLSPRDEAIPAWDALSEEEQHEFVMRMAIYAAQIDAMDQGISKIITRLKEKGQLENTLIMFLSDNGACAEFISSGERIAVDGKADTYESYRINWANLSSTPYKEYKHHTNEGGIATPLIMHYPKGIDKKFNNSFVDEYGHLIDIMATCVELANAEYPKQYKGYEITPMQGVSLVPNFSKKNTDRKLTFWEHEANIAVRDGKWKLVTKTVEGDRFDESTIKLYDMTKDPTEMNDLSEQYPGKKKELYEAWKKWAGEIGVFPMDTRKYNVRQRAYKRDHINGEFDFNYGDWRIVCHPDAIIDFTIDTVNTISGAKTARIDIKQQGNKALSAQLKWIFNVENDYTANLSFKAKAKNNTDIFFRLEKVQETNIKPLDKEILLTGEVGLYEFENIDLPKPGNYQLVFYVGKSDGTIWIDDVKLSVEKKTFKNPIAKGADPWVYKTDSCYYYCFSHKNGIGVSKTRELQKIGDSIQVWKAPKKGWNRSCVWAPELHYLNGKWYIYYAAGESGPPYIYQRTGVLESITQDPQGQYIDKGIIYTGDNATQKEDASNNRWAIDMTVFEWKGKLYAVWSGWENSATTDKTEQNLYIAEMENPWTISTNRTLISKPNQPWELSDKLNLNEGPQILINKEHLFIIYSCGQSWLKTYKLAQLKLANPDADLLNPESWIKSGPVFTGNENVYGVGHASFTTSPDGTENWIVYHSKIDLKPGWERDIRMQRFVFNDDGSPNFGQAEPIDVPQPIPSR